MTIEVQHPWGTLGGRGTSNQGLKSVCWPFSPDPVPAPLELQSYSSFRPSGLLCLFCPLSCLPFGAACNPTAPLGPCGFCDSISQRFLHGRDPVPAIVFFFCHFLASLQVSSKALVPGSPGCQAINPDPH